MNNFDLEKIKKLKQNFQLILPTIYNESLTFEQKLNKIITVLEMVIQQNIEIENQLENIDKYIQENLKNYAQEIIDELIKNGEINLGSSYDANTKTLKIFITK